ncbi:MAG: hypothetical protein M1378_03435 [Bacteroidetes bacterium]|nr:hypothetical protein [Bacteroidota bacterium]
MDKHLNLLGMLYIVLGLFHIVSLSIAALFLFGFDRFSFPIEAGFVRVVIALVFGFIIVVSLVGIVAGIGLMKGQKWAEGVALVLGFILLINVPLGTLLGLYTIWVLMLRDKPPAQGNAA